MVLNFGRGKSPKYVEKSDIKVLNQACIYWDEIRYENVKFQNPDKFNDRNMLKEDSVLVNATGTGTLGRSVVFPGVQGEIYMADSHVMVIDVNDLIILPRYLQVFLSLPETQTVLYRDCVNGSTNQIELSKESFGKMLVPVVDISKQRDFIGFVNQSDKSKLSSIG